MSPMVAGKRWGWSARKGIVSRGKPRVHLVVLHISPMQILREVFIRVADPNFYHWKKNSTARVGVSPVSHAHAVIMSNWLM
jgi:hypothetical protein